MHSNIAYSKQMGFFYKLLMKGPFNTHLKNAVLFYTLIYCGIELEFFYLSIYFNKIKMNFKPSRLLYLISLITFNNIKRRLLNNYI